MRRNKENDTEICITSEYLDSAYLSIKGEGLKHIQILNPETIQKETATEIIAYPEIRFTKTDQPIEVHFVDMVVGTRDWLIYSNHSVSRTDELIRKTSFKISGDSLNNFRNLEYQLKLKLSKDLFYQHMVNSHHGIAHTTRVLFATYLIMNYVYGMSN